MAYLIIESYCGAIRFPAYAAMLEVGRAQRSIFLARWLRGRDLQRETTAGLNVVENYNGVNDYISFGKRGEVASNRREEQELSMTLATPEWSGTLTDEDLRGLNPLFHTNMTPYGEVRLHTERRIDLTATPHPLPRGARP